MIFVSFPVYPPPLPKFSGFALGLLNFSPSNLIIYWYELIRKIWFFIDLSLSWAKLDMYEFVINLGGDSLPLFGIVWNFNEGLDFFTFNLDHLLVWAYPAIFWTWMSFFLIWEGFPPLFCLKIKILLWGGKKLHPKSSQSDMDVFYIDLRDYHSHFLLFF